jgi:hypothetical protein
VSTLQSHLLHLDMSTKQGPDLHLDMSTLRDLCCTWTCLHHRVLSCTWTCHRGQPAPRLVWTKGACADPGRVYTTGAFKCVPLEIYEILFTKNHGIPRNFVKLCDTEFREIPRNFRQFSREYGRDGGTQTHKFQCRRNSVDLLLCGQINCRLKT